MCRPAKTTTGSAGARCRRLGGPSYSPSSTVSSPLRPSSRESSARTAARSRTRAAGPAGRAAGPPADPAAEPAEVLAPVAARPELVPVDDDRYRNRPHATRRRAARSTETRRCGRRRTPPCRRRCASTPSPNLSGGAACDLRVQRDPRAGRDHPHAGDVRLLVGSHWRSVRTVTSCPDAASRSTRLRYQRSAPRRITISPGSNTTRCPAGAMTVARLRSARRQRVVVNDMPQNAHRGDEIEHAPDGESGFPHVGLQERRLGMAHPQPLDGDLTRSTPTI